MLSAPGEPGRLARFHSALPELVAAGTYAVAWVAPERLPTGLLRSLVLAMLVEFLVVHSAGFLGGVVLTERLSRPKRLAGLAAFGALYLGFAAAFGLAFGSWAPVWTMGWLVGSRALTVLVDRRSGAEERRRQKELWVAGAVVYLFGVFLTSIVPLPALGIDAAARERLALPGSGLWIEEPHRVFAFGLFYFALIAWVELQGARPGK
jgi:hypothetical protein